MRSRMVHTLMKTQTKLLLYEKNLGKLLLKNPSKFKVYPKGLINLALRDSDKWDKTTHAKSYIVDMYAD